MQYLNEGVRDAITQWLKKQKSNNIQNQINYWVQHFRSTHGITSPEGIRAVMSFKGCKDSNIINSVIRIIQNEKPVFVFSK